MSIHAWEKIVKQIEQETDRHRVTELAQKLNDAMISEAREKVGHRLGLAPQVLFVLKKKSDGTR